MVRINYSDVLRGHGMADVICSETDIEVTDYTRFCERENSSLIDFIEAVSELALTALGEDEVVFREFVFGQKTKLSASLMSASVKFFPQFGVVGECTPDAVLTTCTIAKTSVQDCERACRRTFMANLANLKDGTVGFFE